MDFTSMFQWCYWMPTAIECHYLDKYHLINDFTVKSYIALWDSISFVIYLILFFLHFGFPNPKKSMNNSCQFVYLIKIILVFVKIDFSKTIWSSIISLSVYKIEFRGFVVYIFVQFGIFLLLFRDRQIEQFPLIKFDQFGIFSGVKLSFWTNLSLH